MFVTFLCSNDKNFYEFCVKEVFDNLDEHSIFISGNTAASTKLAV